MLWHWVGVGDDDLGHWIWVVHDDIGDHVCDVCDALVDADGFNVDEPSKLKRFNESLQDCVCLKQWRLGWCRGRPYW